MIPANCESLQLRQVCHRLLLVWSSAMFLVRSSVFPSMKCLHEDSMCKVFHNRIGLEYQLTRLSQACLVLEQSRLAWTLGVMFIRIVTELVCRFFPFVDFLVSVILGFGMVSRYVGTTIDPFSSTILIFQKSNWSHFHLIIPFILSEDFKTICHLMMILQGFWSGFEVCLCSSTLVTPGAHKTW